jgi:signal transduction histidine kinase
MLGLALVVGSLGLLLGGTLYGLNAHRNSVRVTERKLTELQYINVMVSVLTSEAGGVPADINAESKELSDKTQRVQEFSGGYRKVLATTVELGLDPDNGFQEGNLLNQLDEALDQLSVALKKAATATGPAASEPLRSNLEVKAAYEKSQRIGQHLKQALVDDIETSIRKSNSEIRQSFWISVTATVWAVVLVLALLYYFREWMLTPIRELHAGVQRVHFGDFDHPILLSSRDELEELANEFNAMTVRLSAVYKDLARQVNERSRQLVRSERMVSVGFLAAGVAHEINNPLASILFCAEALERRLQDVLAPALAAGAVPADGEVLTRYLKMIQQEALRCKDITQKLLDFSRTGERKREATDLAGLVRGVLEVARHLPNGRGKHITFNPGSYIVAPVNAQDLKSVILNLVVNALDSMDEGGSLTIRLGSDGDFAHIAFTDTGCGMPPDVLQNIFEPFFTRSRTGKGTGLGLFISHQIVDQHGGQIEAASPGPGHGSTFTVRVPLRETAGGPLATPQLAPADDPADAELLPFPGKKAA